MTAYVGSFALGCGFFAALAGAVLWWRVARRGHDVGLARQALLLMLLGAAAAFGALEWALLTDDFSVRYVAEHGSRATPAFYTATSLWSALDGSLLLWLLVLAGYALALGRRVPRGAAALHAWAMVVLCGIAVFFFGLSLFAGHAFDVVDPAPLDGPGPNPLLADHPAMAIHPPLLYLGFVGLAVPFAYALAALITGEAGAGWLRATRSWTLLAWCGLTAGIVLGAWWSYAVLGWGGYWAWDPVENASLLPWLAATALLHSSTVQRRRAALPAWNVALAASGFLLVCVGTFLTRSDVLASVHSFTASPIGPLLLGFLVVLLAVTAVLLVWRADRLGAPRPVGSPVSRGSALLVNNLLLLSLTGTVLIGTLFPLVAELVSGAELSVGPPYFDRMAVPIALALLVLMAVGPLLRWTGDSLVAAARRAAPAFAVGGVVVGVLGIAGVEGVSALLTFGLAAVVATTVVGEWIGVRSARDLVRGRRRHGALVAHLGVAVLAVGVAASSSYTTATEHRLAPGEEVVVQGVPVQLADLERTRGSGAMTTAAHLRIDGGADGFTSRLSYYPAHGMTVSNPAIRSGPTQDVYVTLLEVDEPATSALLRIAVNPLVTWIWAGGALMVLGAVIAGWPVRRRPRAGGAVPERQSESVAP
ncbi:heme lyase CcmF/NrfE family subunit [Pseudonocardia sp. MH-G8]|uniref:heme lyase CcmF/NrfE family subunit n=1 Tax=Pseudonocardia sp. MH-G8 TaxID=1854588 RepID=UPI000BA00F88|nr:cytochrome c-type biogenesis CcmF C-terminal domain-containing protein [Pseudonocardia sp. MH-G8]OZM77205.1 cytochrome C biogenesis protein CcmF [Pseudonocardia sp. MH-G8]